MNATDHRVFVTTYSLLQHWPNMHYRIGHTIIPGTDPVVIQPDLSMLFYHLPMTVLYFDRSIAAKLPEGAMDGGRPRPCGMVGNETQVDV